jgi:NAD(P)-dependent dehydrogenase (short-subunit alcohol dehydrogenase family)
MSTGVSDSLLGRRIVVIGAPGLLGATFCEEILTCGANLIMLDKDHEALSASAEEFRTRYPGRTIEAFQVDVSRERDMARVAAQMGVGGSSIDGVVFSAGIDAKVSSCGTDGNFTSVETFPVEKWESEVGVGITGPFLMFKHFSRLLVSGSSVVIISSDLSVISPDQRIYNANATDMENFKPVSYSVIKTGSIGFVRYMATYWARREIRVNALSPGAVANAQPTEFLSRLRDRIPMERLADRSEYRGAVRFLLSSESSYMTGQNLVMDGGRSIW